MTWQSRSYVHHFDDVQQRIPGPGGEHFVGVMERGTVRVFLSLPKVPNRQQPHTQDEIYVIARGSGTIFNDGKRERFTSGDVLFVAAGTEHWFEDFTDDFAVWVIFYGPEGGEIASSE